MRRVVKDGKLDLCAECFGGPWDGKHVDLDFDGPLVIWRQKEPIPSLSSEVDLVNERVTIVQDQYVRTSLERFEYRRSEE